MSSSNAINTIIQANSNVRYLAILQGVSETIDLIVRPMAFTRKKTRSAQHPVRVP